MADEFRIGDNLEDVNFVANRETGRWVISNLDIGDISKKISAPFEKVGLKGSDSIVLNMGRSCNFNCGYCLVGDLRNESGRLSREVGMKMIERISEMRQEKKDVVFHGSEPMMNWKILKGLVEYGKMIDNNINFSIQSNGSLFSDERIDFLVENNVSIGVSLDGKRRHQNRTRPYKNGGGTYDVVVDNLMKIKKRNGRVSVITVVTRNNVNDLEEIVEGYDEMRIDSASFNPVNNADGTFLVPSINELNYNMGKICDNYLQSLSKGGTPIRIDNLKRYLGILFHPKSTSSCVQCGAGPSNPLLAVDIDGSIYPCDYFWDNKNYRIGNIFGMSLDEAAISKNNFRNTRDIDDIENCGICDWKRFCSGGCLGAYLDVKGHFEQKETLNCGHNSFMLNYAASKLPLVHSRKLIRKIFG